jgi:hypothetical protein
MSDSIVHQPASEHNPPTDWLALEAIWERITRRDTRQHVRDFAEDRAEFCRQMLRLDNIVDRRLR